MSGTATVFDAGGGDYKRLKWGAEMGAAWFCLHYGCQLVISGRLEPAMRLEPVMVVSQV